MTNHKNRSRNYAKAAIASGVAAVLIAGTAVGASAAPADPTATLTQAEQQSLSAEYQAAVKGTMTGTITGMSIPDAAAAQNLRNLGYNFDFAASVAASNASNADPANDPNQALLSVTFDEAAFKANSPLASKVDLTGGGLDLALGDGEHHADNFQQKADASVPDLPVGVISRPWITLKNNSAAGVAAYPLTHIYPSSSVTDGGVPNDLNGNTDAAHSEFTQSWIVDNFTATPQRQADLTLGGAQRGILTSGLSGCVGAVQSSCGVWITPVASGLITVDTAGTKVPGTMAIGAPVWVQIDSNRAAQTPVHTEANPFVAASGDKIYFAPINDGASVLDVAGSYNLLNPSVAIKPWQYQGTYSFANGWANPSLNTLTATNTGSGFNIPVVTSSAFVGDTFDATQAQGADVNTQVVTITNSNPDLGASWTYGAKQLVAGHVIKVLSDDGVTVVANATVVEASKGKLVLSFALVEPNVTLATSAGTLETVNGTDLQGAARFTAPLYEMKVIKGTPVPTETPKDPTPTEKPKDPVPTETPKVPEISTNETIIPDDALTNEVQVDDLAETNATADAGKVVASQPQSVDRADNGNLVIGWSLAGFAALMAAGLATVATRLRKKEATAKN